MKCEPGHKSILINKGFVVLQISRCVGHNCHTQKIAEVRPGKKAVLDDPTLKQRATVTGKANDSDVIGSFVQVVLTNVTSQDVGTYFCYIYYYRTSKFSHTAVTRDSNYVTECSKYTFIYLMV